MSLLIAHYYSQGLCQASGVTAAINQWASATQTENCANTVISAPPPSPDGLNDIQQYAQPVVEIPHFGRSRATFVPWMWKLRREFSKHDVVVLHEGWTVSHYVAAFAAKLAQKPYIVMPHGVYEPQVMRGLKLASIRRRIEASFLGHAAAVHLFFESEKRNVSNIVTDARLIVNPTGIPKNSIRRTTIRSGNVPHVVWFGRFDIHHKGLDIFLQGLAELAQDQRPRVTIAGYDYRGGLDRLRGLVERLDVRESVVVTGPVHGAEKVSLLESADVYVHPSRWECHSISLLETMAYGVPVAVSDTCHIAPVLEEFKSGWVVPNNQAGWAAALSGIMKGDVPPSGSEEFFAFFSWDEIIVETLSDYNASR